MDCGGGLDGASFPLGGRVARRVVAAVGGGDGRPVGQTRGRQNIVHVVLDKIGDDGKRLTFVTESVENGMPGLRARIIIHLDGKNAIREDFDLAFPGKDFKTCVKNKLTKS